MEKKHHDHITRENIRKAANYIHNTKKYGYADHAIKNKLIEHGYDEEIVDHGFKVVKGHKTKNIFLRALMVVCIIVAVYACLRAFNIL